MSENTVMWIAIYSAITSTVALVWNILNELG